MKLNAAVKSLTDILMTLALLFLMGYPFWGDAAHEWAGAVMLLLFLLHHILNANWYHTIFRWKYTPVWVFQPTLDLMALLAMLGLMVGGFILSRHLFPQFGRMLRGFHGRISFARLLYMAASCWGLVLMDLHPGHHWTCSWVWRGKQ